MSLFDVCVCMCRCFDKPHYTRVFRARHHAQTFCCPNVAVVVVIIIFCSQYLLKQTKGNTSNLLALAKLKHVGRNRTGSVPNDSRIVGDVVRAAEL